MRSADKRARLCFLINRIENWRRGRISVFREIYHVCLRPSKCKDKSKDATEISTLAISHRAAFKARALIMTVQERYIPQCPIHIKHNASQRWCPRQIALLWVKRSKSPRRPPRRLAHCSTEWADAGLLTEVESSAGDYKGHERSLKCAVDGYNWTGRVLLDKKKLRHKSPIGTGPGVFLNQNFSV